MGRVVHELIVKGRFPEMDDSPRTRYRMERLITVCLAGPIAQRIWNKRTYRHHHGGRDHQNAVDAAFHICKSERQAKAFLKYLHICVEEFLREPYAWKRVHALANKLLQQHEMTHKEIEKFFAECQIERKHLKSLPVRLGIMCPPPRL